VADGRSGLLVPGHDPRDYADAIARILDEPGLRASMSGAAREHAQRFSWRRTADETLEVYARARDLVRA
jgi:D-inositol-3-phosphate glycosyltransferase